MLRLCSAVELLVLGFYKSLISPLLGAHCRFEPSCSEYARQALMRYGLFRGNARAVGRLLRCHPWGGAGFDPP